MDAGLGRLLQRDSYLQSPDCEITLHSAAHCPANDTPRVQIKNHSKIRLSPTPPHVADVVRPFLVWQFCAEVSVQQVGRNVEDMVAVGGHPILLGAFDTDTVGALRRSI